MSESSKFTMLGMSRSGKTCYIAGMYMKMQSGVNGFTLVAEKDIRKTLRRDLLELREPKGTERFPVATPRTIKEYHFRMCYDLKDIVSFEIEDYSGETLDDEDEDEIYKNIEQSVTESTVLYIFIDGESFEKGNSKEKRKNNVYFGSAITLCEMIQDFADSHKEEGLPPIVFVVTKADLYEKKGVEDAEVISVIKELFRPAFSKNTTTYITAVSLGETISDDNYRGELNPINVHIPFFIGCYHEYYNRCVILQHDVDVENGKWDDKKNGLEDDIDAESRKWKIFRNQALIDDYRKRISSINDNIDSNQKLLQDSKEMLIRFGISLEHENIEEDGERHFYYFKDGRQMDFHEFQL